MTEIRVTLPQRRTDNRGKLLALFCVLSVFLFFALQYVYMLFLLGMLPTLAAFISDGSHEHYQFKIVGGFNLAGVLPSVYDMYNTGNSLQILADFVKNPTLWLIMLGTAGIGWGLILFMPSVVYSYLQGITVKKVRDLEERQKKLSEEWGMELKRG